MEKKLKDLSQPILLFVLRTLDWYLTAKLLDKGAEEVNPIMKRIFELPNGKKISLLVSTGSAGTTVVLMEYLRPGISERSFDLFYGFLITLLTVPVLNNLIVLQQAPETTTY